MGKPGDRGPKGERVRIYHFDHCLGVSATTVPSFEVTVMYVDLLKISQDGKGRVIPG